jgi:hypothetical protein
MGVASPVGNQVGDDRHGSSKGSPAAIDAGADGLLATQRASDTETRSNWQRLVL